MASDVTGDLRSSTEGRGKSTDILRISSDTEFLHSFLRVDDGEENKDDGGDGDKRKGAKKRSAMEKALQQRSSDKETSHRKPDASTSLKKRDERPKTPPSPPPAGPATFSQLSREIKMKQKQSIKNIRGKKVKIRRQEECYTDKDRAAAVNMGSRDIKQSLKLKRRQDRSRALMIPEEAEPGTLLALGSHELRTGDVRIAIGFVNKALELSPNDKNALVARSKCYLLLGEPHKALEDAETALSGDKNFIRGIFQKAEALYHLGDFEHSLMYYHRGLRIRPELEGFRLGVQKAQEAIENTIGTKITSNITHESPQGKLSLVPKAPPQSDTTNRSKATDTTESEKRSENGSASTRRSTPNNASKTLFKDNNEIKLKEEAERKKTDRHLLGELSVDKHYLEELLKHPDIKGINEESSKSQIETFAEEGVAFLNNRQEFWRQQRPKAVSKTRKKKKI
ncbi:outer dynein arm-docking complex subunit 4 [Lycorma delicatula]|uniref:outer dynein arm-docking complex subunit 4 n=1 Tax=Lycorma delicatula TaxID=130591 RepID=UPI003F51AAE8